MELRRYVSSYFSSHRCLTIVQVEALDQLDLSLFSHRLGRLEAPLTDEDIKDVLINAPLLAELQWRRYSRANFDLRGFASNTLSTLHIFSDHGFSSAEFIGILQSFPSLSDLACPVKPEANNHPAPLTFTKLLSLRLVSAWKFDYPSIHALELLTLPNLGTLVCRASLNPDVISPFLSRSACVIRELRCDFSRDAADMYISQSLQIFPSAETMGIIVYDIASCLSTLELDSDEATPSPPIPVFDFKPLLRVSIFIKA